MEGSLSDQVCDRVLESRAPIPKKPNTKIRSYVGVGKGPTNLM